MSEIKGWSMLCDNAGTDIFDVDLWEIDVIWKNF